MTKKNPCLLKILPAQGFGEQKCLLCTETRHERELPGAGRGRNKKFNKAPSKSSNLQKTKLKMKEKSVCTASMDIVSVLGQEEGYTVKYTLTSEGVSEGKARGNSWRGEGNI